MQIEMEVVDVDKNEEQCIKKITDRTTDKE